jgi:hypothetical protein
MIMHMNYFRCLSPYDIRIYTIVQTYRSATKCHPPLPSLKSIPGFPPVPPLARFSSVQSSPFLVVRNNSMGAPDSPLGSVACRLWWEILRRYSAMYRLPRIRRLGTRGRDLRERHGVRGESSVVHPDGQPSRCEAEDWLSGAMLMLERVVLGSTMRVPLSRIRARVAPSRLAGRGGRWGGGPSRRVNDTRAKVVGSKSEGWGVRTGRDMTSLAFGFERRKERRLRYDAGGSIVGRRGFGGVLIGICGSGGGGGEWFFVLLLRKMTEPFCVSEMD